MSIAVKRAYLPAEASDGYRVLVDRLWPRGVSREELKIDEWLKEAAPADDLRKSFHNEELAWGDFRTAYLAALKTRREDLRGLLERAGGRKLTLVYAAHDEERNNAVVMMQYLRMLGAE